MRHKKPSEERIERKRNNELFERFNPKKNRGKKITKSLLSMLTD